jgi:hypothetical protein
MKLTVMAGFGFADEVSGKSRRADFQGDGGRFPGSVT